MLLSNLESLLSPGCNKLIISSLVSVQYPEWSISWKFISDINPAKRSNLMSRLFYRNAENPNFSSRQHIIHIGIWTYCGGHGGRNFSFHIGPICLSWVLFFKMPLCPKIGYVYCHANSVLSLRLYIRRQTTFCIPLVGPIYTNLGRQWCRTVVIPLPRSFAAS